MAQESLEIRGRVAHPSANEIFRAWERLRLVYNAVLVGVVVFFISTGGAVIPAYWLPLVCNAIVANLCFFAGPLGEWYLVWLGFHNRATRWILFGAGLIFAMALAMETLRRPAPWFGAWF